MNDFEKMEHGVGRIEDALEYLWTVYDARLAAQGESEELEILETELGNLNGAIDMFSWWVKDWKEEYPVTPPSNYRRPTDKRQRALQLPVR